ncbi:MAG: hypothetical protein AAF403_01250 [Pseudomonadota bacterium]
MCGLSIGLLTIIKPVGIAFLIGLSLSLSLMKLTATTIKLKQVGCVFIPLIFCLIVEQICFYQIHDQRKSLLPTTLFGKAAILTIFEDFKIPESLSNDHQQLLLSADQKLEDAQHYLNAQQHYFYKSERIADYETYAQYVLLQNEQQKLASALNIDVGALKTTIGWATLKSNWMNYLSMSLDYYLKMPVIVARSFIDHDINNVPLLEKQYFGNKTSLPFKILFMLTVMFLIAFLCANIWVIFNLLKIFIKRKLEFQNAQIEFAFHGCLWTMIYHAMVALTNISIPRYFMLSFTMITFCLLILLYHIASNALKRPTSDTFKNH